VKHAIIIGAGIAGAATAYSLSQRGWQCTVIEQRAAIAAGASGNRQGILYPLLSRNAEDIPTQFYLAAYLYAWRQLNDLIAAGYDLPHARCGVLQRAADATQAQRLHAIVKNLQLPATFVQFIAAVDTAKYCGFALPQGGLWFPEAGWVSPAAWCAAQLQASANCRVMLSTPVKRFAYQAKQWWLFDADDRHIAQAPVLILANAYAISEFSVAAELPLQAVRGQVTEVSATALSEQLQSIICGKGYITPAWQDQHCIGASFAVGETSEQSQASDDAENLAQLADDVPPLAAAFTPYHARSRVRCASLDHLPLIGALTDKAQFWKDYADLAQGKRFSHYPASPYLPHLYVNVGHGARGLVSAPLAGEILASLLNHEPLPISTPLLQALSPQRFWVRALKTQAT